MSNDIYRLAVEHAMDGFFIHGIDGRFVEVNVQACRSLGYSREECLALSIGDVSANFDPAGVQAVLEQVRAGGTVTLEDVHMRKDGSTFPVEVRVGVLEGGETPLLVSLARDITERKQAEAALHASESMLRNVFLVAPVGIGVVADRYLTWSNRCLSEITGYSAEELRGQSARLLYASDSDFEHVGREKYRQIAEHGTGTVETHWRRKDGAIIDVLLSSAPIDRDDMSKGVTFTALDITARKQGEATLLAERDKLNSVFETMNDGLYLSNQEYDIEYVNPALVADFGPYAGSKCYAYLHGLDDVCPWCKNPKVFAGEVVQWEMTFPRAGKTYDLVASLLKNADGSISKMEMFRDTTERKRAEVALRESEERFRVMAELLPEVVYESDFHGNITFANQAAYEKFGYARRDLEQNFSTQQFLVEGDRERARSNMGKLAQGTSTGPFEYTALRKDRSEFPVLAYASVIVRNGAPIGLRGIVVDITERKRAEEECKALEAQLFQSQKMEAIGTLAGGVAHDFNNLLMVILGHGQLLLDKHAVGDPERYALELICQAGERAVGLTRQLLAFSRKQVLQPRVLNLNDLVQNVTKMLQRMIGEDVEITTVLSPDLGQVKADPGQIEQVLLNLVVNARDAMPRGGRLTIETADVQIDAEQSDRGAWQIPPGPHVQLSVSDTGVGMVPDVVSHIFEPFFTTKGVGEGTGLGLATVYGIVKQSGGSILAYSEPGRGTTFKIYLPRIETPEDLGVDTMIGAPKVPGGTETILLAEDDPGVRAIVSRHLASCGYQVLEAGNPEAALAVAANHPGPVPLLITDVVMPGASGPELAARLHAVRPDTRVLFVSGYTDGTMARHGVLPEEMMFLQKPFSKLALATKVREVLDG